MVTGSGAISADFAVALLNFCGNGSEGGTLFVSFAYIVNIFLISGKHVWAHKILHYPIVSLVPRAKQLRYSTPGL